MTDPRPPSPAAPVSAVGAVVWRDGAVLLIRRGRPPGKGSWTLPGGRQELGETVQEAAAREVREETGVAIRVVGIAGVVDLIHREGGNVLHHFTVVDVIAEWLSGEAVAGDDAAAVAWVEPRDLDDYAVTDEVKRMIAAGVSRP